MFICNHGNAAHVRTYCAKQRVWGGRESETVFNWSLGVTHFTCPFIVSPRTKAAFDSKMQKAGKSTDFRVSLSVCTMFNVLMDAKKQCSRLCVLDSGQEVLCYRRLISPGETLLQKTVLANTGSHIDDQHSTLSRRLQEINQCDYIAGAYEVGLADGPASGRTSLSKA